MDNTLPLALDGYAWLPERRRRVGGAFHTRVMGQRAVGLAGPEAVRFFYTASPRRAHGTGGHAGPGAGWSAGSRG
jgi:fatty-acid peroxygenase